MALPAPQITAPAQLHVTDAVMYMALFDVSNISMCRKNSDVYSVLGQIMKLAELINFMKCLLV